MNALSSRQKVQLSMRGKLLLVVVPCLVLFTLVVSVIIIDREEDFMLKSTRQQGESIARSAAQLYTNARIYQELGMVDPSGMGEYLEYFMADMMRLDPRILRFIILDEKAQVQAHSSLSEYGKIYDNPEILQLLENRKDSLQRKTDDNGQEYLSISVPLTIGSKSWGLCIIDFSLEEMMQNAAGLRLQILISAGVFLAILLLLVWIAGRHFASPLLQLTAQMNDIIKSGDIAPQDISRLPARKDEIGQLQNSFYWMLERLQEAHEQRRRNIEGLLQTEKLATVGRLASGVAHEINNPLGGVILCFKNLCEGGMDDATRQQHIDVINTSLEKIRHTVSELLRFSRPAPLKKEKADIRKIFEHSRRLAEFSLKRNRISIVEDIGQDVPQVMLDSGKLEQVILNLLLNATFELGNQQEKGSMTQPPAILLRAAIDNAELCITVADTGSGIPEEYREQIFTPFFTTKNEGQGTGLGLAVSRALVAQHGGTLTLSDLQPRHGTHIFSGAVFSIRLPMA